MRAIKFYIQKFLVKLLNFGNNYIKFEKIVKQNYKIV